MKIVIDIPKETYDVVCMMGSGAPFVIVEAFRNGTPLPKDEHKTGERDGIKWHPYPKESPTDVGEYLVTIDGKVTIEDATYYGYSGTYQFDSQGVTAWAELLKPYEEGAEDGKND